MQKVKKSSVYTRTGDHGSSSLFNGERRRKTDIVFEALGDTDELNAAIGLAREYCIQEGNGLEDFLQAIQSHLMDIGAAIATPLHSSSEVKLQRTAFSPEHTTELENQIDMLDSELPPLKNFILPGGGLASAHLHLCRTICRRAERITCNLREEDAVEQAVLLFLNRLSDFLFVAARSAARHISCPETIYQKSK